VAPEVTRQRRVLVATGGHAFDAGAFSELLCSLGGFAFTQAEQPAVQREFADDRPAAWDAFLMYDMPGYEFHPDHSPPALFDPPEDFQRNFVTLVEGGHGFVFLHHALASWPTWDDYTAVIGGRFRFVRDDDNPDSGYRHAVPQRITSVAPGHPVLAGLGEGFEIEDEVYLADVFDGAVIPLLVTDAELTDRTVWSTWNAVLGRRGTNDGWRHPHGSNVVAWVRKHPRSRIVYIQFGDGPSAFGNAGFRRLLANALTWVSEEKS
jgi:hypothetical protein